MEISHRNTAPTNQAVNQNRTRGPSPIANTSQTSLSSLIGVSFRDPGRVPEPRVRVPDPPRRIDGLHLDEHPVRREAPRASYRPSILRQTPPRMTAFHSGLGA